MQASCSRRSEESLCAHACTYGDRMVLRCRARASALWQSGCATATADLELARRERGHPHRARADDPHNTCLPPPVRLDGRRSRRFLSGAMPIAGPPSPGPPSPGSHVLVPRKTSDRPLDGAFGATGRLRPPARRRSRPLPTLYTRYAPGPGVCAARWSRRSWSKRASLPNERAG